MFKFKPQVAASRPSNDGLAQLERRVRHWHQAQMWSFLERAWTNHHPSWAESATDTETGVFSLAPVIIAVRFHCIQPPHLAAERGLQCVCLQREAAQLFRHTYKVHVLTCRALCPDLKVQETVRANQKRRTCGTSSPRARRCPTAHCTAYPLCLGTCSCQSCQHCVRLIDNTRFRHERRLVRHHHHHHQ